MSSTRRTGGSKASKAKEREGTPKIFEGVEKYTLQRRSPRLIGRPRSNPGLRAEPCDERDDGSFGRVEFGMWNQRGVETTHATTLLSETSSGMVRKHVETTLEGKRIQDIPILELTSEGKKALAQGEFRPFGGNHRRSAIEILVKTAKAELDEQWTLHSEMTTEAEKSEGKAQLEELTKTIGWLKGEMKWNHLWHLNVWDLDQLRLTSYPEDIIFAHLSRNTNKYVYLETESERVLLDIQEVRSALKRDDDIWASQIASTGDIRRAGAVYASTNFVRELKVYGKRQTQVKGRQNSTTLVYLFTVCGTDDVSVCALRRALLQRSLPSLKGMRVLLEGHLSGIFSTLFDINHRILMVAGSPHPFGTAPTRWSVAFKNAFWWGQGVMKDFLTKSKQYLEAFASTCRRCKRLYGVRLRRKVLGWSIRMHTQNDMIKGNSI
ncbi:hypothetical protein BS47DRAFT_1362057 [Hydnum rufescens UP504]|uniref:Uncharacterized protein n=1 Tax=Hydnum rufescens UP504 TaxID=1448309 RepID=A0A9P6AY15_9AGAM|nr:hypothetical protein BS47DRAFT_1362057 [Hydnum rufescens UP504]